ncbi:unnamed protein product, partial [Ixodes pacificus]
FLPKDDNEYPTECLPRCEYNARFNGTSAFEMSDPAHWRTYFRSTVRDGDFDRLSKLTLKDYENLSTNAPNTASVIAGTFRSPWHDARYNTIFHAKPEASNITNDPAYLYDLLLSYKKTTCLRVVKSFNEKNVADKRIEVYFANEYPCIMVKIQEFNDVAKEPKSLYEVSIAYFVAMTNKVAQTEHVPIELVNRSSFGHNAPSVSEMITTMRINIGIVPEIYAEVLVKSLVKLNDEFLVPFLNSAFKLNSSAIKINNLIEGVAKYNDLEKGKGKSQFVSTWREKEALFMIVFNFGLPNGGKICDRIMKKKRYVDLLTNYVSDELDELKPNLAKPLNKMLGKFLYSKEAVFYVTGDDCKNVTMRNFSDKENPKLDGDLAYWRILRDIAFVLDSKGTHELSEVVKAHKLLGLYSSLEKANLEFIRNSSYQDAEDGCGSDSDCEVHSMPSFYSKKVTVATGMRAINLAHFLSTYRLRQLGFHYQTDAEKMYFETKEATTTVNGAFTSLNLGSNKEQHSGEATVRYLDLNYCAASGPEHISLRDVLMRTSENDVVVFDYTSTNTEKINLSVNLFIAKVQVILLVNSGLKNEQLGADMNPYGTIRIVARDRAVLNELYLVLRSELRLKEEVLPRQFHRVRKAYKNVGATVTNGAIYKHRYKKISDAHNARK